MSERDYIRGSRMAWTLMLQECLKHLDGNDRTVAALISEREQAVTALRNVCKEHGDNDWDESLHLADVIEKHLGRHLDE
jgi:hypothetical protein